MHKLCQEFDYHDDDMPVIHLLEIQLLAYLCVNYKAGPRYNKTSDVFNRCAESKMGVSLYAIP